MSTREQVLDVVKKAMQNWGFTELSRSKDIHHNVDVDYTNWVSDTLEGMVVSITSSPDKIYVEYIPEPFDENHDDVTFSYNVDDIIVDTFEGKEVLVSKSNTPLGVLEPKSVCAVVCDKSHLETTDIVPSEPVIHYIVFDDDRGKLIFRKTKEEESPIVFSLDNGVFTESILHDIDGYLSECWDATKEQLDTIFDRLYSKRWFKRTHQWTL